MPKQRRLSDILWDAANKHLESVEDTHGLCASEWSCNAALIAEFGDYLDAPTDQFGRILRRGTRTDTFLRSLGCDTGRPKGLFGNYRPGEERQGVRYLWLLLAMCVAEDEGL